MNTNQKRVGKFLRDRKWDSLRPADIAKSITIEAAELLEHFQWEGKELAEEKKDKEKIEEVKDEVADVIFYCLEMAYLLGFDADLAVLSKLKRAEKKYDAKLFNTIDEVPGTNMYWKIKKEHRAKKSPKKT